MTKAANLDGDLLFPGDPGYDAARSVWNAMIDHRPALIARCASVADVVTAVRMARERDLEIGVRCGGHNIAGLAVPQDGLMIDLRGLAGVEVDPVARRARVQGGALLGALDRAAQGFGLATTAGNVSHTGVGGLTLGGGMGWLARRHGLTCDNVVSFTVVTADGDVIRASADEHPDLFWGLRGGGGNFGVVVEFELRLHPVGTRALVAELAYPLDRAAGALRGWRDLAEQAPREATLTADVARRHGDPRLRVGRRPGRRSGPAARPALDRYASERGGAGALLPVAPDPRRRRRGSRSSGGTGRAITCPACPTARSPLLLDRDPADATLPDVGLQAYGGAIADVADAATAFGHRGTRFEYVAAARWTDRDEDGARMTAARATAAELEPFAVGAYVNALSDEGAAGVRRAYPEAKLARLTAVKDAYDPGNVFRRNHNIAPSRTPPDGS